MVLVERQQVGNSLRNEVFSIGGQSAGGEERLHEVDEVSYVGHGTRIEQSAGGEERFRELDEVPDAPQCSLGCYGGARSEVAGNLCGKELFLTFSDCTLAQLLYM